MKRIAIVGILASSLNFGCGTTLDENVPITIDMLEHLEVADGTPIAGRYIVVLKESSPVLRSLGTSFSLAENLLARHQIRLSAIDNVYSAALTGFIAHIEEEQAAQLAQDDQVLIVEQDKVISLGPIELAEVQAEPTPLAQTTPYGIKRVNGGIGGATKSAWVIDTGIDLDHPDLNVDSGRSKAFGFATPDDGHGHGTHVAGTIAAIDNARDVIGVAAGANVVAIRVLNSSGSGTTSQIIQGVDHVAANGSAGDVANMSLGGGVSTSLDNAVINASSKGIWFTLSAGNSSKDANGQSPARANGTYIRTISAIDSSDKFASFSNYGNPPIDYAEPGVSVLSLWNGGTTRTASGTSMAAPHHAGILLLGSARTDGYAINDPDGKADPIGVH